MPPDIFPVASSSAASAGISGGPVVRADGSLACIVVTKSETQLRAITVAYMNSILLKEARMNLLALGQGDYPALAAANRSLISAKQLIALREGLLRKR